MKIRNIEFFIEEAFTGIRRNGVMAVASISTTALALGILGTFILAALGANNFAASQIGRFQIAVFTRNSITLSQTEQMAEKIRKMQGVGMVTVRDRDKEWMKFKKEHPDIESAGLPLNVLPFALDVKMTDPDRLPAIAQKIRSMEGIDTVREGRETFGRVMALAQVVKAISIVGVAILLLVSAFIISNAIKLTLYARRREIRIMQLVGATNEFIRVPLVIEGIVFGICGAVFAWFLLRVGASYIMHIAKNVTPIVAQFSSGIQPSELALGLFVLGGAIGAAGSLFSIRRFLHDA